MRTGVAGCNAIELARKLLQEFGSLRALLGAEQAQFCQAHGLGPAKYVQLQAVLEMSNRYLNECLQRGDALTSPLLVRRYLQAQLRDRPREVFAMLLLDNQHRVLQFCELFFELSMPPAFIPREIVQQC